MEYGYGYECAGDKPSFPVDTLWHGYWCWYVKYDGGVGCYGLYNGYLPQVSYPHHHRQTLSPRTPSLSSQRCHVIFVERGSAISRV